MLNLCNVIHQLHLNKTGRIILKIMEFNAESQCNILEYIFNGCKTHDIRKCEHCLIN